MKIFAIRDEFANQKIDLAYLLYYEAEKRFYIELPDDADPWKTPLLLSSFVKKGEKSSMVVFWKQIPVKQQDTLTGECEEVLIPMLRYYSVFHIDQCEGLNKSPAKPVEHRRNTEADTLINNYLQKSGVTIIHQQGDEAYYSPSRDIVTLPLVEQFASIEEYYSTAYHELSHSTGHQSRLNRLKATAHFGNAEYSKEELVAEISAAALMNYVGLETKSSFRNSSAYIQSWLSVLKKDNRLIVSASGAAAKAFELITG